MKHSSTFIDPINNARGTTQLNADIATEAGTPLNVSGSYRSTDNIDSLVASLQIEQRPAESTLPSLPLHGLLEAHSVVQVIMNTQPSWLRGSTAYEVCFVRGSTAQ